MTILDAWPFLILPHLFKGEVFCEKWRWHKWMEGERDGGKGHMRQGLQHGRRQQRCNEDHDRHHQGVMLQQLRGWERGESLRQRMGDNQRRADPTPDSACLIYCSLLVYSSAHLHLKDAKQSNSTLHAVLNNLGIRGWQQQAVQRWGCATRAGETWDAATSTVYKQDMAAKEKRIHCKNSLPP